MLRVREVRVIPTTIAEKLVKRDIETKNQFIRTIAMREGLHPTRYGFYSPEIKNIDGKYKITWEREDI